MISNILYGHCLSPPYIMHQVFWRDSSSTEIVFSQYSLILGYPILWKSIWYLLSWLIQWTVSAVYPLSPFSIFWSIYVPVSPIIYLTFCVLLNFLSERVFPCQHPHNVRFLFLACSTSVRSTPDRDTVWLTVSQFILECEDAYFFLVSSLGPGFQILCNWKGTHRKVTLNILFHVYQDDLISKPEKN